MTDDNLEPHLDYMRTQTRRHFLRTSGSGIGAAALGMLMGGAGDAFGQTSNSTLPIGAHFAPKAKRVIYLHMAGSPPQHDLFDYKPELDKWDGKPCPDHMFSKERFPFIKGHPKILPTPYEFKQYGKDGTWISELLPNLQTMADDITVVRSMHTEQFNHAPAQLLLYTGSPLLGRPSMGSWLTYGLGSENKDLPGFVVLVSGNKTPSAGKSVWGSGFLPSVHQGVQCRSAGDPVLYLSDPQGMDRSTRRKTLDAIRDLNEMQSVEDGDPEIQTRISQYELAFRMQVSVPDVMDISKEDPKTLEAYGAEPGKGSFANNCLLARRLVEKDVRFVQLFDWGWDVHGNAPTSDIINELPKKCQQTDKPITALLRDLKKTGLLDETLVVWTGEFGRTAMNEERDGSKYLGRDHHPGCYTIWAAGGGIKAGANVGATDEFGYEITDLPIHVHDLQATMLHCMGIDHERLTYRFQGRDYRLTDISGRVVPELLA
jgi:hypothetical protein